MGGGRQRASTSVRVAACTLPERAHTSVVPAPPPSIPRPLAPSVTPVPLSVIPAPPPSFLRRQEPTHPRIHTSPTPSPIHPSPLPGGRLGGGWKPASVYQRPSGRLHSSRARSHFRRPCAPSVNSSPPRPLRHTCAPLRHSCAPSVIPAQAGTHASTHPHIPYPFPNSSLPPSRGEVRWGVEASEPAPPSCTPIAFLWSPRPKPSHLRPRPARLSPLPGRSAQP